MNLHINSGIRVEKKNQLSEKWLAEIVIIKLELRLVSYNLNTNFELFWNILLNQIIYPNFLEIIGLFRNEMKKNYIMD